MGDQSTNIFVIYANILFWLVKTISPFYLMGKQHLSNHSEESSGSYAYDIEVYIRIIN